MGLKDKRSKRRAERDQIRAKRKKNFQKLKDKFEKMADPPEDATREQKFKAYWPFFERVLIFLRDLKITKERADLKIDEIIEWGNSVKSGEAVGTSNQFAKRFGKAWKGIRFILKFASFIREKWDTVIDKIIDIGDFLAGWEGDTEEA